MIDAKLLRDDPDAVRASQRARGEDEGLVDAILAADRARRDSIMAFDGLRSEQKGLGRQVATATGDEKEALLARTKELATAVKDAEAAQSAAQTSYDDLFGRLSNVVEGAPPGGEQDQQAEDNQVAALPHSATASCPCSRLIEEARISQTMTPTTIQRPRTLEELGSVISGPTAG